eukprot:TRINITY_DN6769_c0_g2_i1.p1 TRINITY_DN6769_c0_g2~~TRINITY_DN6769_c0_g2_i1.p1  ORF type:complete len:615 (-),score=165.93 TRINITY_DN6769_c0_g2_i1:735-2579(-)
MNSGLQCMSNTIALRDYFLQARFLPEINEVNPLGTKGALAKKFASFMQNLWYGTSDVYSPWNLKQAIGKFQPMFSGYSQHDSQELISYVLDGLHEDLNRVKVKPYVETIENEGKPDEEAARQSWLDHRKRNDSIIVDIFQGQFKSQLQCPQCSRISITYDPFMMCSLPIPTATTKSISFVFISADPSRKPTKHAVVYPKTKHMVSDLEVQAAADLNLKPGSFYFAFITQYSKEYADSGQTTSELRKKAKYKTLFLVEYTQEEQKIPEEERVRVDAEICRPETYYGRTSKRNCSFIRTFVCRKETTAKEVYLQAFIYFRPFLQEYMKPEEQESFVMLSHEEAYERLFKNPNKKPPFEVLVNSDSRGWRTCYFCGEKCDHCVFPENDTLTIGQCLAKAKAADKDFGLEIYFSGLSDDYEYKYLNKIDEEVRALETIKDEEVKTSGSISVSACLRKFEEPEQLDQENAWYCNKCKDHVLANKRMAIYKAPPVMILHLKRFKNSTSHSSYYASKSKNTVLIDFPEELDFTDFVVHGEHPNDFLNEDAMKAEKGGRILYELYAISNHYGDMGFGHYTAYCKNSMNGKWYHFDDSSVTEVSADQIVTKAAYVLFYRRKGL